MVNTEIPEAVVTAKPVSTLIEFPGAGRAARPQWRKDLSERVREIREKRARDAGRDRLEWPLNRTGLLVDESLPPLGLVPQPAPPSVNPIVTAALKRLERAYQPTTRSRTTRGNAAVAVAHEAEEQFHEDGTTDLHVAPAPEMVDQLPLPAGESEPPRERTLTVVQSKPATLTQTFVPLVASESVAISKHEVLTSTPRVFEDFYDDRAPVLSRVAGGLIDLVVVAFASSPFAAVIELTNGNWADDRVLASMAGIIVIVTFLYLTSSTVLAGRTWGMSLVSLRAVDVDTGLAPTTRQSIMRAAAYMLSLATLGLGIIYALFDAEGRTAHDHFSGTAVIRE